MTMRNRVLLLLSLNRYPEFLVDLVVSKIQFYLLRRFCGLAIGGGIVIRGLPIITISPGSSIKIGSGMYLISRSKNTALGVNHPSILRTLNQGARMCIGARFKASGVTICAAKEVVIGDRVMMGANVTVIDTDFHSFDPAIRYSSNDAEHAKAAPVIIADDVFVGMGAVILKGVTIGQGAVVGAGSVVTGTVAPFSVVAGNPARIVGSVKLSNNLQKLPSL